MKRIIFLFLILLATFQVFLSQEKLKAILVQEFGDVNCDESSAIIDVLFTNILNEPNSKGYIVIYGSNEKPLKKYLYEMEFKADIMFRNFDTSRIIFLHGKNEKNIRIQFWKVPASADKPDFVEGDWNYRMPQDTKSLLLFKDSWIAEVCHASYDIKLYSKVLLANPQLKGQMVIYAKSARNFYQTEKSLLNALVSQNKIPRNQLKFFYIRRKNSDVEFWLVPKSKL